MDRTCNKRGLEEVYQPKESKKIRVNYEEEKVEEVVAPLFGLGNFAPVDITSHILSHLTPKEFLRLGGVSKLFFDITHNDKNRVGVEVKYNIAENGRPTYLLEAFLDGDGLFDYLDRYFRFIRTSSNPFVQKNLIKFFEKNLENIFKKISVNSDTDCLDFVIQMMQEFEIGHDNKHLRNCLSSLINSDEFFPKNGCNHFYELIERYKTSLINFVLFEILECNIQSFFDIIIGQGDFIQHKKVFEWVMRPATLVRLNRKAHDSIAFFVLKLLNLKVIDNKQVKVNVVGNESFKSKIFLKILCYSYCLFDSDKKFLVDKKVESIITNELLDEFGSFVIKDMIVFFGNISKLGEDLKASCGLRALIKLLHKSDFIGLLKAAKTASSADSFDALLDVRFAEEDNQSKIRLSVFLGYGCYANSMKLISGLSHDECSELLSEAEGDVRDELAFQIISSVKGINKLKLLTTTFYQFGVSMDTIVNLAVAKLTDKQFKQFIDITICKNILADEEKVVTFLNLCDSRIAKLGYDSVYSSLIEIYTAKKHGSLNKKNIETLRRLFVKVLFPKLSKEKRFPYLFDYYYRGIISDKELLDFQI